MANIDLYKKKLASYEKELSRVKKKDNLLVTLRTFLGLGGLLTLLISIINKDIHPMLLLIPIGVLFIIVLKFHNKVLRVKTHIVNLVKVNTDAIERLNGNWTKFPRDGKAYIDQNHPYTKDLNIFGQGSLFQYINTTTSKLGEKKLSQSLMVFCPQGEIPQRQEAIKELAPLVDWRQQFQATGLSNKGAYEEPTLFFQWAQGKKDFFKNPNYIKLIYLFPLITIGILTLVILKILPLFTALLLLMGHLIIVGITEKHIGAYFSHIDKILTKVEGFTSIIQLIESRSFNAPFLKQLKGTLKDERDSTSKALNGLAQVADRISFRYSPLFHIPINILTFWDLVTIAKLENWRKAHGNKVKDWFEVVGELEALNSFADLAFNNPEWATPEIVKESPFIQASDLGHPLIHREKRITNNFSILQQGSSFIITGSNMSGKSTFLRTVGINLVLAYCGSVVCSKSFRASFMEIYSSMQTSDSLEEAVSSFYAELRRIKLIVDAANRGKPLFYLLDEIFKGTNSKDRIFGAKTIINQLSKLNTIGLVTTHDLELGQLANNSLIVKNFHFTDKITDNQISFDYKIRPGISPTTNAVALMKMIGIDIEES